MPKATLEYQLPEEQGEFDLANNADKYYLALWEVYVYLRNQSKYYDAGTADNIGGIYRQFLTILEREGVELP